MDDGVNLSRMKRVKALKGASDDEASESPGKDSSSDIPALSNETASLDSISRSSYSQSDSTDGAESARSLDDKQSADDSMEDVATASFGELAKAQSSLGKRKRGANGLDSTRSTPSQIPLRQANDEANVEALERKAGKKDTRDFSRPSKHAPAELSSKKAVSRKRGVVPVQTRPMRDPRFESLSGPLNEDKIKKNYAFLETYRDSEMAELRAGVRRTRDPAAKETLKRALLSMESRKKAQIIKDQRQEVLRKHRKEEKERVEAGKKPFYLKKGEIKERALVERFKAMKGKQVERVIERRRKKQTAKERKGMPFERRG